MDKARANILCYPNAHGYGHAIRCASVLRELSGCAEIGQIFVRSTCESWIFNGIGNLSVHKPLDPRLSFGVVERNPVQIDSTAALAGALGVIQDARRIVDAEVEFIRENDVALILADIPYLVGMSAERVSVPCLALGNFTWDYIYEPFLSGRPDADDILRPIRASYKKMTGWLKLPFSQDTWSFKQVLEMPLVARVSPHSRDEALKAMGEDVSDTRPRVLIAARGDMITASMHRSAALAATDFVFLYTGDVLADMPENLHHVATSESLTYADLIRGADAVVAKLGYGIVSDCVANETAILWRRRAGFREDEIFEAEGPQYLRMHEIPAAEFEGASWASRLRSLLAAPQPPRTMSVDGAAKCAEVVLRFLS